MIVTAFGGQPDRSSSRLTAQASAILAAERDERGRTPVLVIDEAHLLRYEQLETIRMLTNHNLDADSPLACLLVGLNRPGFCRGSIERTIGSWQVGLRTRRR